MHNHYIINGVVEFHPATSTLRSMNNQNNVVVLNSPAGRCLLLLINRIGTIVSQHEFMEIVWAKRGMLVSSSTYYQNISILRKGLKKIGLNEDPIVTIPRIGLTLASSTQIKKLTTEHEVEVSHKNAHFIDVRSLADELKTLHPTDEKEVSDSVSTVQNNDSQPVFSNTAVRKSSASFNSFRSGLMFWGACALMSIFFVSITIASIRMYNVDDYFSSYQFSKTVQGCHIYLAQDIATNDARVKAMSRINQFKDSCASYPWVYVKTTPLLMRTSIIRCNKSMKEPNSCISDYFFEGN